MHEDPHIVWGYPMRAIIFLVVIIGFMAMEIPGETTRADSQNSKAGILDGMVFVGHVGPKGSEANGEDEVVFQDGQFLSTGCSRYGFGSAPYTAFRDGKSITFTAETHSPKHGQIDWRGRVVGEEVEASYTWTKERWYWFDAHEENWLKARLKKD